MLVVLVLVGVAVLVGVLLIAGRTRTKLASHAGTDCQLLFVPAFFGPGANWSEAVHSTSVPKNMILDVTSTGAGSSLNPTIRTAVRQAQAAGITMLGYADTKYAERSVAEVETNVRNYRNWYGVTDIFLDEVSASASKLGYYRQLSNYVHSVDPGSAVWLNPGIYPAQSYMSLGAVVMVFEGTYASYVNLDVPGWVHEYPASSFAHTIYGTSSSELANVLKLAESRHAGHVYVTDGSGSDPYSSLPGYWSQEDSSAAGECAGSGGSLTPTAAPNATS